MSVLNLGAPEILQRPAPQPGAPLFCAPRPERPRAPANPGSSDGYSVGYSDGCSVSYSDGYIDSFSQSASCLDSCLADCLSVGRGDRAGRARAESRQPRRAEGA